MIFDQKLEHHLLSGLLRKPNEYLTIQSFFSENDIYSEDSLLRRTILSLIRQAVEKGEGESVDAMIIAQRLEGLGIKFDEEIPVGQFVESLALRNIPEGSVYKAAVELKKLSERRKLLKAMADASETLTLKWE
jgi:replicative DNA helicase